MNADHEIDIQKYVDNPDNLVALCDAVFQQLRETTQQATIKQKQAQLKEVSRSIQQLEKLSIAIPDELRELKLNLVTELETSTENKDRLEKLLVGLRKILQTFDEPVSSKPTKSSQPRKRKRRTKSDPPITQQEVFRDEIIIALMELGGAGTPQDVVKIIEKNMAGRLLAADYERRSTGEVIWENNVHWQRYKMKQDGILRSDSPKGLWELSEEYK